MAREKKRKTGFDREVTYERPFTVWTIGMLKFKLKEGFTGLNFSVEIRCADTTTKEVCLGFQKDLRSAGIFAEGFVASWETDSMVPRN